MTGGRRIGVVGAGMAAARFAQQLAVREPGAVVTMFGDEEHPPYNRALLADVLGARLEAEAIRLPVGPSAIVATGTRIDALDAERRSLVLADGEVRAFDAIVLATGAGPVLPPIRNLRAGVPPLGLPALAAPPGGTDLLLGVHAFRSLTDCAGLAAAVPAAERAVVIGGGVLGVGAARALAALGVAVEIVHQAPHLMERHLDSGAATALRHGLAALGVAVYLDNRARALTGTDRVTGVELANGHVLDADLVVLACGVRPRVALARDAGLRVATGVVVDDRLATSAAGVYAIGDCAEFAGHVPGLAAAAWDQADVLAAHLTGGAARYAGSRPMVRLTAGPLAVAAFGATTAQAGDDVLCLADPTRNAYKKIVIRGDRLVAGILIGDLATAGTLSRAFERDDPLPADPLHLLATPGAHR